MWLIDQPLPSGYAAQAKRLIPHLEPSIAYNTSNFSNEVMLSHLRTLAQLRLHIKCDSREIIHSLHATAARTDQQGLPLFLRTPHAI